MAINQDRGLLDISVELSMRDIMAGNDFSATIPGYQWEYGASQTWSTGKSSWTPDSNEHPQAVKLVAQSMSLYHQM